MRVGIAAEPGVFAGFDAGTKKASGATVEILQAIAEDIDVDLQYVVVTGAGTVPYAKAIADGRIDIVANTYQITPERQALFDFSDPVVSYGETLVIRKNDQRDFKTAEDLKNLKVAVIAGSNYVDIAKRVGADPVVGGSLDGAAESVDNGKVDAAMGTAPTLAFIVRGGAFANIRVAKAYVSHDIRPAGFGLRKGDTALLQKINGSLARLKANGTVSKLLTRYGFE
ncbi:substrate-binding periplasmic protein [Methylosinus sp. LW4]|uniref:substrate-binding periplasmic protein n=1 Tax=Methylosinus sp. LW4 TaxID=136993 RepID=UPI000360536D|nr:transporter substrate-binding domain-containing protein [Methylosinus sp. LW4]